MIAVKKQVRRGATPPPAPNLALAASPRGLSRKDSDSGLCWVKHASAGLPSRDSLRVADAPSVSPWQIWVGGTGLAQGKSKGKIYVIDAERKTVEKELVAHVDTVKTLCSAEDRYVLSGSGRGEGKIAIWKVE